MTQKMVRTRNTWVAYILLALYAYFLNIPGPITPFLRDEFNLSYTASSLHFSAFAAGILVIGLSGQVMIHRIGRQKALSIGALGLASGAVLLVLGRSPVLTIGGIFIMGLVGSLILAVVPAFLSDEHGELSAVAISEANMLSSLISMVAPLLVGWFVRLLVGWRPALILAALPVLVIGVLLFIGEDKSEAPLVSAAAVHRLPLLFWFLWVALVFAVSIEFCMIYWSADYLVQEFDLSSAAAAQSVSLFLAGMILGRWLSSRLLRSLSAQKIIFISIFTGIAGFLLYWNTDHSWLALTGLALTGLGVASFYPLTLSLAIGSADGNEAQAGARASLASGVAIMFLPLLLGRFADSAGLKSAFVLVAVLFGSFFLMMLLSRHIRCGSQAFQDQVE